MNLVQALLFAILQGVTELFPVSSLGHAVVLPAVLHWDLDENSPHFLPFLVTLHLGTAAALLLYFWRDWYGFLAALLDRSGSAESRSARRLLGLLILATLPAVIVGFAFEKPLKALFGSPMVAAVFLIVNGVLLFVGERLRQRAGTKSLGSLTPGSALAIGVAQCTALVPGISRSGATMVGGLVAGLSHAESARFSFLMATPIILGAAVLEIPKLLHHAEAGSELSGLAVIAGLVAGVTAYISVAVLMRYFKRHEFEALDPFAYYCWAAGGIGLALLIWT